MPVARREGWEVLVTLTVNGADAEAGNRRDATGRRWRMTQPAVGAQAAWWPGIMADVAAAVGRRSAAVSGDVYEVILREVPQLHDDTPVLALLASSVDSNVDTCLQIMQHRIDLAAVQAPAAATEYARRLAQRGTPLTALLRAYRLGHARFSDWVLKELAQQAGDAHVISAAALGMSGIVAGYIDQVSEEMVAAWVPAYPPAGPRRPVGRAGSGNCRAGGGDVRPGRARGDDARVR